MDIGTLRGSIAVDTSPFERGLDSMIRKSRAFASDLKAGFSAAGADAGRGVTDKASEEIRKGSSKIKKASEDAGEESGKGFEAGFNARGVVSRIGGALAAIGAVSFGAGMVKQGVQTAASLETASIGFETMLGSAEKADSFIRDMQDFAAKTPFTFPGLQTAASSLISIGIDTEKVLPIMTTLGDVTSGMGTGAEGIQRATVALQQMNAAQKISAEDLNQLRDAGIPVYDLLSAAMGKSKEEIADLVESGKLGKDALDALMGALESGAGLERFNGLMEKQSQSLSGLYSTFTDNVEMGMARAVEPLIPKLKEGLDWLNGQLESTVFPAVQSGLGKLIDGVQSAWDKLQSIVSWVRDNRDWLMPLTISVMGFLGALAAIGGAAKAFSAITSAGGILRLISQISLVSKVTKAWSVVQAGLNLVMSANPIGLVVIAIAALAAGLVYAYQHSETFRNVVDGAFSRIKEVASSVADWFTGTLVPGIQGVWETIKGFFSSGADKIGSVVESIKGFFTGVGDAFRAVGDWIAGVWDAITDKFAAALAWLDSTFSPWGERIHAILVLPINLASTLIGAVWDWITARFLQAADWLSGVFSAAWALIESYVVDPFQRGVDRISSAWDWVISKFNAAWDTVSGWVSEKWNQITSLLGAAVESGRDRISDAWGSVQNRFNTAWDSVRDWVSTKWDTLRNALKEPVERARDAIDTALQGARDAFSSAVDFIRTVWDGIVEAVKKPIRFVMTTVIDDGLIAGFNKIADFADSPHLSPITPPGFAAGGYVDLPWSASNRDPYLGQTANGAFFRFEGTEFIVNREATAKHRGLLEAINSGRLDGFEEGGFLGRVGSAVSGVIDGVMDAIADPGKFFSGLIDKALPGIADSSILRLMVGIPRKLASVIADWVKNKVGSLFASESHGEGVERWRGTTIQAMQVAGLPLNYLPLLMHRMEVESGGDPNAINLWDSNAAAGIPSMGLMQTIGPTFYAYAGPLAPLGPYNPLANIYAAIRYTLARYGLGGIQAAWGGNAGYANGTGPTGASRGWRMVGEYGPEMVYFRGGETVLPNGSAISGGQIVLQVTAQGDIEDQIRRAMWVLETRWAQRMRGVQVNV